MTYANCLLSFIFIDYLFALKKSITTKTNIDQANLRPIVVNSLHLKQENC